MNITPKVSENRAPESQLPQASTVDNIDISPPDLPLFSRPSTPMLMSSPTNSLDSVDEIAPINTIKAIQLPSQRAELNPKTVFTYWDKGEDHLPKFGRDMVNKWREILGGAQGWDVIVVDGNANSDNYFGKYINSQDIPSLEDIAAVNLINNKRVCHPAVVQSDHIRLALLETHGGIWMDPTILLHDNLDRVIWDQLTKDNNAEVGGFITPYRASKSTHRLNGFENWFIAAKKDSSVVKAWRANYQKLWAMKEPNQDLKQNPIFKGNQSVFRHLGFTRNYLLQHAALSLTLQENPEFTTKFVVRYSTNGGPFELKNQILLNPRGSNYALSHFSEAKLTKLSNAGLSKFANREAKTIDRYYDKKCNPESPSPPIFKALHELGLKKNQYESAATPRSRSPEELMGTLSTLQAAKGRFKYISKIAKYAVIDTVKMSKP